MLNIVFNLQIHVAAVNISHESISGPLSKILNISAHIGILLVRDKNISINNGLFE